MFQPKMPSYSIYFWGYCSTASQNWHHHMTKVWHSPLAFRNRFAANQNRMKAISVATQKTWGNPGMTVPDGDPIINPRTCLVPRSWLCLSASLSAICSPWGNSTETSSVVASSNAAGSQYEGFLSHGGSPIAGLQLFTMENSMKIGDLGYPLVI